MILFLIWLVAFLAVASIVYLSLPRVVSRLDTWQEKKAEESAKGLNSMFIFLNRQQLAIYHLATPILFAILGYLLLKNAIGLAGGVLVGVALPSVVLKLLRAKHRKRFEAQLIDTLIMISSSLKAGLSLTQALKVVAEEMPAPTSQEFGLVLKENQMGIEIGQALVNLKQRVNVEVFNMVITSILVARETGADLTQIFHQLTDTIREELKLKSKVAALCVQGKIQGVVIALLPIAFAIFVTKTQPKFFDVMLNDTLGRMLLLYAAVSQIVGMVLIIKLSKVEF